MICWKSQRSQVFLIRNKQIFILLFQDEYKKKNVSLNDIEESLYDKFLK